MMLGKFKLSAHAEPYPYIHNSAADFLRPFAQLYPGLVYGTFVNRANGAGRRETAKLTIPVTFCGREYWKWLNADSLDAQARRRVSMMAEISILVWTSSHKHS